VAGFLEIVVMSVDSILRLSELRAPNVGKRWRGWRDGLSTLGMTAEREGESL